MPRKARVVLPGTAHHVIQRGNYQQVVFQREADFRTYLYLIANNAAQHQIKIHAFCLMSNHVHFIVTPADKNNLAEFFRIVHVRYSHYKNLQWQRSGQLWQGRFYSCVLSETHLLRAVRYVEMNPVRAKLVQYPWEYFWSSSRQHLEIEASPIVPTDLPDDFLKLNVNHGNWRQYLMEDDAEMIKEMRENTKKGLAVGPADFITQMENRFGISLRKQKPGRK